MPGETVFTRYENNPIIGPENVAGSNSIFNSAVVPFGEGYAGVFRIDTHSLKHVLHRGFSKDGISWDIEDTPIKMKPVRPGIDAQSIGYDPRITQIDDTYYITWCGANHGPCIAIASTKDFQEFIKYDFAFPPYNRNGVLFPKKINGKFVMIHRPSDNSHTPFGQIFMSSSPDLEHWGEHRFVLAEFGSWAYTKVGPGPVPIETDEGWLCLIHGVRQTCSGMVYVVGGMVLDLEDPSKIKYLSSDYLLAPTELYERVGDVPNVVFPVTNFVDSEGRLRLYYGCADTCVGLAFSTIDKVLSFIKEHNCV